MLKKIIILIFVVSFQINFAQTNFTNLICNNWEINKTQFIEDNKNKQLEEKSALIYTGYLFKVKVDSMPLRVAYFFNSDGEQKMRGISNAIVDKKNAKETYKYFINQMQLIFDKPSSETNMLGVKMIRWENDSLKFVLNYKSDTCLLSILKN